MDNPTPLEQTDPELAESLRLIANRQHPVVRGLTVDRKAVEIRLHSGSKRTRRMAEPNQACPCGSNRKFKKCCGK